MKNTDQYIETKYNIKKGKIVASKNEKYLAGGSFLNACLIGEKYEKAIPKYCTGKVLDLGCGNVPLYNAYKNYMTESICVDWMNTRHKNNLLDCVCDLTNDLPLQDNTFDTVLLSDVLEHIFNPEHLLREIHRVLKQKGYLIFNVPFFYWIHEEPYDYGRYTIYWYKRIAEKLGYQVKRLETIGDEKDVMVDITGKMIDQRIRKIPLARWYQEGYLKLRKRRKSNSNISLGYFMVFQKK